MKNTYDVTYLRALDTPYVLLYYAFSKTNFYQLNLAVTTTLLKEFFQHTLLGKVMLMTPFPKLETIHGIAIPMPYPPDLITANVYAVGKGPITLIDTGPKIPGAFEFVRKKFQSAGLDFSDIERIIITHGHVDHFGLAVSIREAAGHQIECFITPANDPDASLQGYI